MALLACTQEEKEEEEEEEEERRRRRRRRRSEVELENAEREKISDQRRDSEALLSFNPNE